LKEHPTRQGYLALGVIALGVACMTVNSLAGLQQSWPGDLLLVFASSMWALYTVLVKHWNRSPVEVTMGVALLSALVYLPIYILLLPKTIQQASWHVIALQGFFHGILVVIVAMLFFMQAMVRLGPTRLGAMMSTVPAIAGIGAVAVLGEPLTTWLVCGLLFTSLGAWMGSRSAA
jgi:drug/metabolite transporter (DMT)-like permease